MKMKRLIRIVMLASCLFFIGAGNAMAAEGDSFLDEQVAGMNPAVRPFAQLLADNLVFCFNFLGGCAILGFGLYAVYQKKRGHTQNAADAKHTATDVACGLLWTMFLFNVFVALSRSGIFGV